MLNIYEAFGTDLVDEAKTFPLSDTASITLVPTGGEKAKRAFEKMMEPYSVRLNSGGKLTEKENKDLNVRFFAEHIIKGWEGITDDKGEEIKFSPEAAKALLSEKKLEGFFLLIIKMASDDASFAAAREEDDAGN
ncbi:hypothetical protein [Erythrobacter phage vB_EliS-L02]|nr:hypothetical protein [Erythrobacter phage vB_EliS-L02]